MVWEIGINWVWEEVLKVGDVLVWGCFCGCIFWYLVSCLVFMEGDCYILFIVFVIFGVVVLLLCCVELVDKYFLYFYICCLMDRSCEMWS